MYEYVCDLLVGMWWCTGHGKEAESLDDLGVYSHLALLYVSSPGVRQSKVSVTHLREKKGNFALAMSVRDLIY